MNKKFDDFLNDIYPNVRDNLIERAKQDTINFLKSIPEDEKHSASDSATFTFNEKLTLEIVGAYHNWVNQ